MNQRTGLNILRDLDIILKQIVSLKLKKKEINIFNCMWIKVLWFNQKFVVSNKT